MGGTIPLHSARGLLQRARAAAGRALTAITARLNWQVGLGRLPRGCGYLLGLWLGRLLLPMLRGLRLVVASEPFCLLRLDRMLFYRNSFLTRRSTAMMAGPASTAMATGTRSAPSTAAVPKKP